MKKFALFVKTEKFPVPRLCNFTATGENILGYQLASETMRFWIRKGKVKQAIAEGIAITPDMCEIFTYK